MLNAFHSSASLRLVCALALSWPLALVALFLAIAWFPSDPYSAVGGLSWVNPAIVATVSIADTYRPPYGTAKESLPTICWWRVFELRRRRFMRSAATPSRRVCGCARDSRNWSFARRRKARILPRRQ